MVFHKNLYRCRVILGQLAACVNVAFINHDDNSLSFVEIRLYVCLDVDQMTECMIYAGMMCLKHLYRSEPCTNCCCHCIEWEPCSQFRRYLQKNVVYGLLTSMLFSILLCRLAATFNAPGPRNQVFSPFDPLWAHLCSSAFSHFCVPSSLFPALPPRMRSFFSTPAQGF